MSQATSPVEQVDDKPQVVKADLRKFNRAEAKVNTALARLATITTIKTHDELATAMEILKEANLVHKMIDAKRLELTKPFRDATDKINAYAKGLTDKIPPEIKKGKDAILDYEKRETERLRAIRTEARHTYLVSTGMVHHPEGTEKIAGDVYVGEFDITVPRMSVDYLDDGAWQAMLTRTFDELQQKKSAAAAKLQQEKEGHDFFGDTVGSATVQEKIDQVAAPVKTPAYVPSFGGGSGKVSGTTRRWTYQITDPTLVPREYLCVNDAAVREAVRNGERNIPGINIFQESGVSLR